jgi:hypothetical protein
MPHLSIRGLTVAACAALGLLAPPAAQAAIDASANFPSCREGSRSITLETGKQGLPLPNSYSNRTPRDLVFRVRIASNDLYGSTRTVRTLTLPAGTGQQLSGGGGVAETNLSMPVGAREKVTIYVTANRAGSSGSDVVGRCDYDVTLAAPSHRPRLVQVPLRFCVTAGSPQAQGLAAGRTVSGDPLRALLRKANGRSWLKHANLAFAFPTIASVT